MSLVQAGDAAANPRLGGEGKAAERPIRAVGDRHDPERQSETGAHQVTDGTHAPVTTDEQATKPPSYKLAVLALLVWVAALSLATVDEYWGFPHAASVNAGLLLVAVLVIFSLVLTLRRMRAARRSQAVTMAEARDPVTGLPSYRYLHLRLGEETARARRYRRPLALALIDVNSLNAVNSEYGWACGDQILRHVGAVLKDGRRGSDLAARLADDRFAVILPECDEQGAQALVHRFEQRLARSPARVDVGGKPQYLWAGISAGVAVLGDEPEDASSLVDRAEARLRTAKQERDQRRRLSLSA